MRHDTVDYLSKLLPGGPLWVADDFHPVINLNLHWFAFESSDEVCKALLSVLVFDDDHM